MTTAPDEQGTGHSPGPIAPFPAGPVAWDEPGARRAWFRHLGANLLRLVGWPGASVAVLVLYLAFLPSWTAIFVVLLLGGFLYCLAGALFGRLPNTLTMLRILRTYPWRQQSDGVRLRNGKAAVFVLPDPDRPESTASPKEPGLFFKQWERIVRKGFSDVLWYAGDPRFAVVVAKPGLKAMGYARQPTAFNRRTSPRSRGLSPDARRRAVAIRARVGPPRGDSQN